MSLATRVTNKIKAAGKRLGPLDTRVLYKRVLTETGGDSLIDRGVTQTITDTAFSDQPLFSIVGNKAPILSASSGKLINPDDYQFLLIPSQMTYDQVVSESVTLVFKDTHGSVEVLDLVTVNPIVLNGIEAGCFAVYRSVSRS